jgi:hypothetical protein
MPRAVFFYLPHIFSSFVRFFVAQSAMSSIANSLDLLKIVKFKPQNAGELFTKVDRFARHPGVWPYMLSSLIGITVIKSLSVGASGT